MPTPATSRAGATAAAAAVQVADIVESGVASAAPAIGQQLQEAGQLLSKAGQEAAGQLQVSD
jgi:hypothetical protein